VSGACRTFNLSPACDLACVTFSQRATTCNVRSGTLPRRHLHEDGNAGAERSVPLSWNTRRSGVLPTSRVRTGIERPGQQNQGVHLMSATNTRLLSLLYLGGVSERPRAPDSVAGSRHWGRDAVGPQFAALHLIS
jgi:hypothetical protein